MPYLRNSVAVVVVLIRRVARHFPFCLEVVSLCRKDRQFRKSMILASAFRRSLRLRTECRCESCRAAVRLGNAVMRR
jgi:hypothetical protein